MNIEIVAIGDEILKGMIVNTNAAEISSALYQAGYFVQRHEAISDEPQILKNTLKECLQRNRIVITTGGLGPTCDDHTRQIAAELFDSEMSYHTEVAEELKKRYGTLAISLENQATLPNKATILKNPVGTACGLVFHNSQSTLILMPGVPREMRLMLRDQLIPFLLKFFPPDRFATKTLHFSNLSESLIDPVLRQLQHTYPMIEFGIYPGHGVLAVNVTVRAISSQAEGERLLEKPVAHLIQHFASHYYESPSGKIAEAVQNLFVDQGWSLSTAESCTGGGIAARLTQIPGASQYFLGTVVTYSDALKISLLGVSERSIKTHGAVSKEVVQEMIIGLMNTIHSDFGLAVSGIAGPDGGSIEKPVGTIWAAVMRRGDDSPHVWTFQAFGNREMIIEQTINGCLGKLNHYCRQRIK